MSAERRCGERPTGMPLVVGCKFDLVYPSPPTLHTAPQTAPLASEQPVPSTPPAPVQHIFDSTSSFSFFNEV